MNEIFTNRINIDAQIEEVWEYFSQLDRYGAEWMKGIHMLEKETQGEVGEGTTYSFGTRGKKHTTMITEFEPMRLATLTSVQGNFRADYTYSFIKDGDSTEMTLVAKCKANGITKVLSPIIKMAIKKSDQGQLEEFKDAFEGKKKD